MSETSDSTTNISNEKYEQEVSKVITLEQKIQSDSRNGVLKHLGGSGLNEEKTQQLHEFADMAANNAIAEYEALKNTDPSIMVQDILVQNKDLILSSSGWGDNSVKNVDNLSYMKSRLQSTAEQIMAKGGTDTQDALLTQVGYATSEIRTEAPRDPSKFDNNLGILKAFGAIPDDVTDLAKFIREMPQMTDDDHKAWAENGKPNRAVNISGGGGVSFRDLPTKIPDVYISGHRLYSTNETGYGQLGFEVLFTKPAVGRILDMTKLEAKFTK